ncbi:hypothetical protein AVEN_76855-1 [Araneus ventricosus]|uniref:Uncharacterized protein n=1 Tax=Araneus ventricosus TaxID=182803 RepID=A0A4Y2Q8I2_ARAVE|nr:hypothetical protein AVEN_76855-1 [Araneus ventricosus]
MDLVILNCDQMARMTPELAPPSPNFHTTPQGGRLTHDFKINVHQAKHMPDLQWNRISNLESFSNKAETLPLDHHGPINDTFANLPLIGKHLSSCNRFNK